MSEMQFVWETVVLTLAGILLLRLTGRKSFSQMTIASSIVMVSIGTVIVQPVIQKNLWKTILAIAIISALLIIIEYIQMKFNLMELLFTGNAKVIIQDGKLNTKNLMKLRLTIDQLEMHLRQKGISKISDVKTATLESNGKIGYELMPDAQPLTVGELKKVLGELLGEQRSTDVMRALGKESEQAPANLFDEVKANGHHHLNPEKLK